MKTDPRAAAGAPRVLIVENESIIALELGESLRELGYEVVWKDWESALSAEASAAWT